MPRRSRGLDDGPSLFDLPLEAPETEDPATDAPTAAAPEGASPASGDLAAEPDTLPTPSSTTARSEPKPRSLFDDASDDPASAEDEGSLLFDEAVEATDGAAAAAAVGQDTGEDESPGDGEPRLARTEERVLAGLVDLGILTALGLIALIGADWLGSRPELGDLLPLGLFLLIFSLAYSVVPLAFWGATPGMAWQGLIASTSRGDRLSFAQAARRWLGSTLSLALLGLPVLPIFGGRSLSDFWSGSVTLNRFGN